ncbi:VCBS domain-containing protein [Limnohabitans sp.]|uniref:VCBS domain-containing protein n=1 Tax=Limnohabitans sp. TaxID=1907725 RepID=UPI00260545B2|nr:VCBS domain-containing protein [Limnohabitans sp.]
MLNVNTINAKNSQKFEVKPGQPTSIKVEPNTRFELADPTTGKAPVKIKARRAGDNLEIVMDEKALIEEEAASNAQSPDLVLENYYKQEDVSLFAGTGEAAVSYVPVDGAAAGSYAAMSTSATTGAALGVLPLLNPWVGAAVLGTGALAAAGSGKSNQAPVAQDAAAKVDENKLLSDKVPAAIDSDGTVASYRLVSDVAAGKLTFNADGSYSFDANKDFDGLAAGQTRTVSFTYSAVDNAGGVSEAKTVSITVIGANDAPVAIATNKAINEGVAAAGSVTASDADSGAKLTYALTETAPAGLSFYKDGTYMFDANNVAYNSLKAGELKTIAVEFKANDGTVDSAEQTLTIVVKGVNDKAVIAGTSTGQVTEDAPSNVLTGKLTVTDVDTGEAAFKPVAQAQPVGKYGHFTFDAPVGEWSYTLDNTKAQALYQDQAFVESMTVSTVDGTTSVISATVKGVNDVPVFQIQTGDRVDVTGLTEDPLNAVKTSGSVTVSDPDVESGTVYAVTGLSISGGYTPFKDPANLTESQKATYDRLLNMLSLDSTAVKNGSGKLDWNFDSVSKESLDMIPEGETMVLEYTVTQKDPHGESATQTVTIEITGTNDAPKVQLRAGDSAEGKIVDLTKNVTGSLTIIDEDGVGAYFKTVSLDGNEITNTATLNILKSLFVYDPTTSTFETKNEDGNYDWIFKTSDAVSSGLSSFAGAGDHKLTYNMNFRDDHLIATSQEINILFTV